MVILVVNFGYVSNVSGSLAEVFLPLIWFSAWKKGWTQYFGINS